MVTPLESRAVGGRARTGVPVTTLVPADLKSMRQSVDGLAMASPTTQTVLRLRAGDLTKSTTVIGCEPEYFAIKHWGIKHWEASQGEIFDSAADRTEARVALLGATAARDLFGESDPTGEPIFINRVPFQVVGVLEERGQGLDAANEDDQVYVPLQTAMHRLADLDHFDSILLEVDPLSRMNAAAEEIDSLLAERHRQRAGGKPDYQIQNRKALIDTQLASFARITFLMRWIAVSALAVSSLGVFAVTWIGVRNRTREVGARRAIGATRADVLLQFFAEGLTGACLGCAVGPALSYLVLRLVDQRAGQPFLFSARAALADLVASMALYSAFTLVSALRSTLIRPIVALRAE